jgi:hypothetical protein
VLLLAGLTAPASLAAAPQPKSTAKGEITALNTRAITVSGRKCEITTASPTRATIRLYFVGADAKIACANGILRAIDVLKSLPPVKSTQPTHPAGGSDLHASAIGGSGVSLSQTTVGGITSSASMSGSFTVLALGNGSITAGRPIGPLSLTCTLGDGSPEVGGFEVGDTLSNMQCKNGALTLILT